MSIQHNSVPHKDREAALLLGLKIKNGRLYIYIVIITVILLEFLSFLSTNNWKQSLIWLAIFTLPLIFLVLGKTWTRPVLVLLLVLKSLIAFIGGFLQLGEYPDFTFQVMVYTTLIFFVSMAYAIAGFLIFGSEAIAAYIQDKTKESIQNYLNRQGIPGSDK